MAASTSDLQKERHFPKPRLVMFTLIGVSLPVEIFFLGCVVALGWIHLPLLFIVLKVIFFLVAVSRPSFFRGRLWDSA